MRSVRTLLSDAALIYDEPGNHLHEAAHGAVWGGFSGGAEWMRKAMGVVRGKEPLGRAHFGRLGTGKYACAGMAALLVLALLWRWPVLAVPAAIVTFYSVELRLLFVFPLALEGERAPFSASHQLVASTQSQAIATTRLISIAARMLFGGLVGRGFVRSWCVGCLAVVLWYEEARRAAEVSG